MAGQTIDYNALAKQAGAITSQPPATPAAGEVDYTALAQQAGAVHSTPIPPAPGLVASGSAHVDTPLQHGVRSVVEAFPTPLNALPGASTGFVKSAVQVPNTLLGWLDKAASKLDKPGAGGRELMTSP